MPRDIWAGYYDFMMNPLYEEGTKCFVLDLRQLEVDPKLIKKVKDSLTNKCKRTYDKQKYHGFTGVVRQVVKHEVYNGEETEIYNGGSGVYFWLEDEPVPPYQQIMLDSSLES